MLQGYAAEGPAVSEDVPRQLGMGPLQVLATRSASTGSVELGTFDFAYWYAILDRDSSSLELGYLSADLISDEPTYVKVSDCPCTR